MSFTTSFLKLPAFLLGVLSIYYSLAIVAGAGFIQYWKFWGQRNDMYRWGRGMMWFYRVRVVKYGKNDIHRAGRCLYLANHRSWADFFMDAYLCEGRAALMSRLAVFWAFPAFMSAVMSMRGVLLFRRTTIRDKEKFNRWIDRQLDRNLAPSLLVYPEGHRGHQGTSQELKRGMLHYAHSRKLPIQIIMTGRKEDILCEKTWDVHWDQTLITGFSETISSADLPEFEEFYKKVLAAWQDLWSKVNEADPKGLPDLVLKPDGYDYTLGMRLAMLLCSLVNIALMLLFFGVAITSFLYFTEPLGQDAQLTLGLLAVVYFLASVVYSYQYPPTSARFRARAKVQ